jgi:hypothetical protein
MLSMHSIPVALAAVAGSIVLSGCAGLSQIQTPLKQFDQSAHSLASSEGTFIQAIRTTDCNSQFYQAAFNYSRGQGKLPSLDGDCSPTILSDNDIKLRLDSLDALTAYADKLQALAAGTNTALDASAQTIATDLNKKFPTPSGAGAAVETAIIELTNIVLDQIRFSDVKTAAKAASPAIKTIADDLTVENTAFSSGIGSKLFSTENALNGALNEQKSGPAKFFDSITARDLVMSANPFGNTLGGPTGQASADSAAQKLNMALDALVKANDALANADNGGIVATVNDLVARVKDAQTIHAALSK